MLVGIGLEAGLSAARRSALAVRRRHRLGCFVDAQIEVEIEVEDLLGGASPGSTDSGIVAMSRPTGGGASPAAGWLQVAAAGVVVQRIVGIDLQAELARPRPVFALPCGQCKQFERQSLRSPCVSRRLA